MKYYKLVTIVALLTLFNPAWAGTKIKIDDEKSLTIGLGLRTEYVDQDAQYIGASNDNSDFSLSSLRVYLGATITKNISLEVNTECEADGANDCAHIRVLDGVVKIKFSDLLQVWAGRFLPPSDRSNLSGPYYLNAWAFPVAQRYPAIFAGRDDGVAVWGEAGGGKFKYQLGVFDGVDNANDDKLMAARLTYNFFDPEPGYYNSSTYYGSKHILAVGLVYQQQSNGVSLGSLQGDFQASSLDLLFEMPLASKAVLSLEGAAYQYDYDNINADSEGGFVLASYLMANKIGPGRFQPMLRWQSFEEKGVYKTDISEIGFNYIMDGHNIRFALIYQMKKVDNVHANDRDGNSLRLGMQFQL